MIRRHSLGHDEAAPFCASPGKPYCFTAIILTLDESSRIVDCIESLTGVTNVFVVDSGSVDDTRALAEKHGATVFVNRPHGSFIIAEQRNWALENLPISTEWVLFIDADERATPEYLNSVQMAVLQGDGKDGYWAAPKFLYQGTWLKRFTGYPNWHSRVMRRAVRLVGGTWETFPSGGRYGFIPEPYLHFPDDRGLDAWLTRHIRYAKSQVTKVDGGARARGKRVLMATASRLGGLRPFAAILYHMFLRGGILDGGAVWSYARRTLIYELMIVEAGREARLQHGEMR